MSAKEILPTSKIVCNSRPNCPCKLCGSVRLLIEHTGQRVREERDSRGIPNPEAVEHALEVTGQAEAKRRHQEEIDALAERFIAQFAKEKR